MKKSVLVLLVVLLVLIFMVFMAGYIGIFTNIKIEEKEVGGYKVVGKEMRGSYSKVGELMMDVDKQLKDIGINSTKGFGIYYDDPKTVPADSCRSFVGNVLEEKDEGRMDELALKGFKIDSIPFKNSIVAYFPIKTRLSYMIGPMKVYPEFSKYINEKGYKVTGSIEIYNIPDKRIEFIMQYDK